MKDKLSQVREFLLDGIESGRFPTGSKLPGARDIAAEVGASFLLVQHAVSSLEQDGIVECVSRRGTYVRTGWEYRRIRNHMLLLTFSTGEKRLFDATRLLSMSAFSPLADEDVLKAFEIDHGVLTWQNGAIDIAPEALYRESFAYEQRA